MGEQHATCWSPMPQSAEGRSVILIFALTEIQGGHASFSRILLVSTHIFPNANVSFADGLTQLISSVICYTLVPRLILC